MLEDKSNNNEGYIRLALNMIKLSGIHLVFICDPCIVILPIN
jgi:hypothetical protein